MAAGPARRTSEGREGEQHEHDRQRGRLLEEGEVGAVEVDADVAGGERADEQEGEKGPDADRRGDAGALEQVEEKVHGLAFPTRR